MYKRLLVPLDGSKLAEAALAFAKQLSGRLKLDVTFLHICGSDESQFASMHHAYVDWVADNMKRQLEEAGIPVDTRGELVVGHPAEEILQYAQKNRIDLILMASHGRSGVMRWALGSVADKVVRATNRPVALIRAKGARSDVREKGILNRVLVPLDGSKGSEAIIPYIEELASKLKTEVILLRIVAADFTIVGDWQMKELESFRASAKDYIESVVAKLKQKGINAKAEFIGGTENTAEVIIRRADELNVDAVAMSTHGRSGVGRWAFGSITERVLQAGTTPLLLVRTR